MEQEAYLASHGVPEALIAAVRKVVRERPADPISSIADSLLAAAPGKESSAQKKSDEESAASTITGYLRCMNLKLKASGRGEQNAEMLLVQRTGGKLTIEDFGGWAIRNVSMSRMLRELDASGALPDFAPILVQTGDRCIAKLSGPDGGVNLHLWQNQPVPDALRERLPLSRVVSMCGTPKYADVPIPDWCFDAWPEAGVAEGGYDEACAELAGAGAAPPTEGNRLSWCGTQHHHPSRLKLVQIAAEHAARFAVNNVVDRPIEGGSGGTQARHLSLADQTRRYGYLLDIQGKGYSSRLKLLLHTGRPVFVVQRPWREFYMSALEPLKHYIPVKEDLSDLIAMLDWADTHAAEAAAIGSAGQVFAQTHLTKAAALAALSGAIKALDQAGGGEAPDGAAGSTAKEELRRGDWATNRGAYDAVRMYYRWTFMPVSKDRRRPLSLIASRGVTDLKHMDVYTFGVYTGASLKFWFDGFDALGIETGKHWGFDSFEGLPDEAEGMELECRAWLPGSFSAADQFGEYTFEGVRDKILEHIGEKHAQDTHLIKGFFSDSLTPTLVEERAMKPALLVDVDVDLYISCIQCMDWMFAHGLIVPGTVVYYDDVSVVKADGGGELRAHDELTVKYNVTWRKLHDSCWEVVSIGGIARRERRSSIRDILEEDEMSERGASTGARQSTSL